MEPLNCQEPVISWGAHEQEDFAQIYSMFGEKPKSIVRFFNRTDCYTVHGEDCETVAKLVYKSTKYIHHMQEDGSKSLPYLVLSKHSFENAVRELLLVRNFRLEVYEKHAYGNEWHILFRGSPGNLLQFENILFSNTDVVVNNIMISLQILKIKNKGPLSQRKFGIASVDQNNCLFQLMEFIDDDFFTELEAMIVLLAPKECLLTSIENDYAAIKTVLERNGVMVTITPDGKNDVIKDLNRLIRFFKGQHADASALPEVNLPTAMEALRFAINYLDLTTDSTNFGQYTINQLNPTRFVHLNSAAVSALHLFPHLGVRAALQNCQSVCDILDHCCTPQGHRLMKQWILQPLRSREILNDRHNIVQCLMESSNALDILRDYLKRIPDIVILTKRMMRNRANLQDLFRVYQALLCTPTICNTLLGLNNPTVKSVLYDSLKFYLEDLVGLKNMVEKVIDLECTDNGEFLVKPTFNKNLKNIKDRMLKVHSKMEGLQKKATSDLNLDRGQLVRLENVSHLGYHFRITLKDDSFLRKNKKYTIVDVVKGGVRFTTDQLSYLSEEFQDLSIQYQEQQKSIVEEILNVAAGYSAPLALLNDVISQLDCLASFSKAAQIAPFPYVRPKMLEEGNDVLELKDLRHPCLEMQENLKFIPNHVYLKKDVCNMMIITGPNMGGKSTYIRSVGIAVLMAHVGSFVPCSLAVIPMVDCILGRIGASDDFSKGLSTFMVEMVETSSIIRIANEKSLVIIDELGRGTSTFEGCGIAWSIAEHLANEIKCFTLFATHFTEITQLSRAVPFAKNYHMAAVADAHNVTLLYQVRPGAIEKSFGIQVARLANLPDGIIQDAQIYYKELENQHASSISGANEGVIFLINQAIAQILTEDVSKFDLSALIQRFKCDLQKLGCRSY